MSYSHLQHQTECLNMWNDSLLPYMIMRWLFRCSNNGVAIRRSLLAATGTNSCKYVFIVIETPCHDTTRSSSMCSLYTNYLIIQLVHHHCCCVDVVPSDISFQITLTQLNWTWMHDLPFRHSGNRYIRHCSFFPIQPRLIVLQFAPHQPALICVHSYAKTVFFVYFNLPETFDITMHYWMLCWCRY